MQEHGLPRSVLDTDHLDPGDRYDAWRDSSAQCIDPGLEFAIPDAC